MIEKISKKLLDRKYTAVGVVLMVLIIGFLSFKNLDIEAYPDFANPKVQVITQMPGKGAEDVERLVTIPLEKEFNGIPGKEKMFSTTIFGLSVIDIIFKNGLASETIRPVVLERIYQTEMPGGIKPLLGPDTSPIGEIFRYTVESKYYNPMSLKAIEDWQIERMFKQIPDIINVNSFGGPVKTFKVVLNLQKVRFYGVDIDDIYKALEESNSTTGGHYIDINSQAFIVRGIGLLSDALSIENVVIQENNGLPVRIKDVANVIIEPAVRFGQVGKNNEDDIIEGIVLMKKGANPTKTIKALKAKIPDIQTNLPKGVKIVPFYERQQLVDRTVHTIGHNILLGVAFVVIVLFAYTRNLRVTLIASIVIPLSILFAFMLFDIFNIPANLLSLGAVDFGIIVDGAIIVVENIYRHFAEAKRELQPEERKQIIIAAVKEIYKVILFSTLIIWLCFLPLLAFDGVAGKLFHPLAFTMGFTLLGAILISLFVIPSLCLIFFEKKVVEAPNHCVDKIVYYYKKLLKTFLRVPQKLFGIIGTLFIIAVLMLTQIGSEFMPNLDEGNIWLRITILPRSTTIEHAVDVARTIRKTLLEYPEAKGVVSQIGSADDGTDYNLLSNIEVMVDLKLAKDWRPKFHKNKEKLISDMSNKLKEIPGINTYFTQYIQDSVEEAISGAKGQVAIKIFGMDLKELQNLQNDALVVLHSIHGVVDLTADKLIGQPQYQITIDREKAARYGINSDEIQRVIEIAIGGKSATELIEGEKRFNVFVRLDPDDRDTRSKFENILIKTSNDTFIPLKNLAKITQTQGAMVISRTNNQRCTVIRFNIRGRDLGSTVKEAQTKIKKAIILPDEYRMEWTGQSESQHKANLRLIIILPITLMLVAMLLHIAFKDWTYVTIAMAPIVMAFIGGVFALFITHTYFSISAGVGFIAAIGVCIQNGVIILSALEHLRQSSTNKCFILLKASVVKLRPVLMASSVAILGLLPAALSNGIGAQSQKPFAITIIGALLSGTIFSVFLIPVLFNIFKLEEHYAKK